MERVVSNLQIESEKQEKPILTDRVLIEITRRCYVGCDDCYKGKLVNSKAPHLAKDTIIRRLTWVKEHVQTNAVNFIGGEPLLHPDFPEIVNTAQEMGLKPEIITAGQVSSLPHEQSNYKFMLEKFESGELDVELSYQPGRNESAFKRTYKDLLERASIKHEKLRKKLKYMRRVNPEMFKSAINKGNRELDKVALFSTVTIPSKYQNEPAKFKEVYKFLLGTANINIGDATFGEDEQSVPAHVDEQFSIFVENNKNPGSNAAYQETITLHNNSVGRKEKTRAKIWAPVTFERDVNGNVSNVMKPLGTEDINQICPAMTAYFYMYSDSASTDTLTIRTDGELTFSTPSCIASPVGFLNVDRIDDNKEILLRLRSSIEAVRMTNMMAMRHKAERLGKGNLYFCKLDSEYPTEEGKNAVCPSCPFDVSCNSCLSRTEGERESYFQAIKEVQESTFK